MERIELDQYLNPLKKWWWLILATVALTAIASTVVVARTPDTYYSRATILVGQAIADPNPSASDLNLGRQLAVTYAELAKRSLVRDAVAERLGFPPAYQVNVPSNNQLVEVSSISRSPAQSQAVAQAVAEELIALSPNNALLDDPSRQAFIQEELVLMEGEISRITKEIQRQQAVLAQQSSANEIAFTQSSINSMTDTLLQLRSSYSELLNGTANVGKNSLTLIEPATLAGRPMPKNRGIIALSAFSAGVLAIAAAYLLESLDDSIRSPEKAAEIAGYSVLTEVAKMKEGVESKLVTLHSPRSPISESYRYLRTNVQYANIDSVTHSLLVTSCNPSEGKSTTIANLAVSIAQAGQSVLLIDADLRKPVQHKMFELPTSQHGLTSMLIQMEIEDLEAEPEQFYRYAFRLSQPCSLTILPCGNVPPNPSETLGTQKMKRFVKWAETQFDVILVDTPPVLAVTDSLVVGSYVDKAVVVIESGRTNRKELEKTIARLHDSHVGVMGLVVNQSKSPEAYYYYYGSEDDSAERTKEEMIDVSEPTPLKERVTAVETS